MRLLAATLLLLAATAQAGGGHIDTIGAAQHEWEGTSRCRGAKIRALQDALIESFDLSTKNTEGSEMRFFAYEAFDDSEDYALVPSASAKKRGSIGDSFNWESSPRLNLRVSAQKFYVLLACWGDANRAGYRGGPKIAPLDISFGEYVGGTYFDGGIEPPHLFRPATATNDYLVRVHSADSGPRGNFVPFHDTDPFLTNPSRGRPGVELRQGSPSHPETGPVKPAATEDSLLMGREPGSCTIPTAPAANIAPACGEL